MEAGCSMCLRIVLVLMRFADQPSAGSGGGGAAGSSSHPAGTKAYTSRSTQQALRVPHVTPGRALCAWPSRVKSHGEGGQDAIGCPSPLGPSSSQGVWEAGVRLGPRQAHSPLGGPPSANAQGPPRTSP